MISSEQICAARAILKWSQGDLSRRSGVSVTAIAKIETDAQKPTDRTLDRLAEAFRAEGIEFIEGGVRRVQNIVNIIEGPDCYLKLLDDVFLTLHESQGELLKSAADERRSSPAVVEKLKSIRQTGITSRSLIRDKSTYIMGPLDEYRWLDDKLYADGDVKLIYANKVAYLMSWLETFRVVIIQDRHVADESRRIFEFLWDISKRPTHTTATVLFEEGR